MGLPFRIYVVVPYVILYYTILGYIRGLGAWCRAHKSNGVEALDFGFQCLSPILEELRKGRDREAHVQLSWIEPGAGPPVRRSSGSSPSVYQGAPRQCPQVESDEA